MTRGARAATLRPTAGQGADQATIVVDADPAVRVTFTGRSVPGVDSDANLSLLVGEGDAVAARRAALRLVGATLEQSVFAEQVHGGGVAVVSVTDGGRGALTHDDAVADVDALVTTSTDVALGVLVADCVPVILIDPGHAVAAVHAGRGGVSAQVVGRALQRLTRHPERVVAFIGPAIGGCCYEVPAAIARDVSRDNPAARATTSWGTPSLDLPAAVAEQLHRAAVTRVERVGGCTRCESDTWFSHRAATAGDAPHGRQAAFVVRASDTSAAAPPHGSSTHGLAQSQ